jgi:DNA-binding transcriptional MerR regulator
MRMAELAKLSGVARETIHYYLREGLLAPGEKSGKTISYYDDSHLERLRLIRHLREEKYLPVAVIRSILRAGLEGSLGSDLDTLADVLMLDPTLAEPVQSTPDDEEAKRVARELGLVDPGDRPDDPTVARVLGAVAEALGLEGSARDLTLEDMRASAPLVRRLVDAEAGVFFDSVVAGGDMPDAVRALRAGRGPVARFLTAYRDLMLRRIIDELLRAISDASALVASARALGLGPRALERHDASGHRDSLVRRSRSGDAAAANDLVWHLFAVGPARDLVSLPREVAGELRPRAELVVAHARVEQGLEMTSSLVSILAKTGGFPLGEILVAETLLYAVVGGGSESETGPLEGAVPALHQLFAAHPERDADPLASACAFVRRGLIAMALPRALGKAELGISDLEHALEVVIAAPGRVHPAARARIEGNARLSLGRALLSRGRASEALRELRRASEIDPDGPIGHAAEAAVDLADRVTSD